MVKNTVEVWYTQPLAARGYQEHLKLYSFERLKDSRFQMGEGAVSIGVVAESRTVQLPAGGEFVRETSGLARGTVVWSDASGLRNSAGPEEVLVYARDGLNGFSFA